MGIGRLNRVFINMNQNFGAKNNDSRPCIDGLFFNIKSMDALNRIAYIF